MPDIFDELGTTAAQVQTSNTGTTLTTGLGDDTLFGGTGDDVLNGNAGDDQVFGGDGNDVLNGGTGNDLLYGGLGTNTLNGGAGDDTLYGGGGANILNGGDGNDLIIADSATGSIDGGLGIDTLDVNVIDISGLVISNVEVLVTNGANISATTAQLQAFTEIRAHDGAAYDAYPVNLNITGAGSVDLTSQLGPRGATITASDLGNTITTGLGNDVIYGGVGDVVASTGAGDDGLFGGGGNDDLNGGDGNDLLNAGRGNDTSDGGLGSHDVVALSGAIGDYSFTGTAADFMAQDNVNGTGIDRLQNVEFVRFNNGIDISVASLGLAGNAAPVANPETVAALANIATTIAASALLSNDTDADLPAQTLAIASVTSGTGGTVTLNLDGSVTFAATVGFYGTANFTYLATDGLALSAPTTVTVDVTGGGVTITGTAGNDTVSATVTPAGQPLPTALGDLIFGLGGNDTLDGAPGDDRMYGGAGNDTYIVNSALDQAIEADPVTGLDDGGVDTVKSGLSFTLGVFVENLALTGTAGTSGTGNALNNLITGNAGANVLTGDIGRDSLAGGGGADVLYGGVGNERLDGGALADTLAGGGGNDTYIVDNIGDVVDEVDPFTLADSGGTDLVSTGLSYTLGNFIENLTLTGTAGISGTGNALNNLITGNAGANVLTGDPGNDTLAGGAGIDTLFGGDGNDKVDGGPGNDVLYGGAGNDTYVVNSATDVVSEADPTTLMDAGGIDQVTAGVSYLLAALFENLTLSGGLALDGTGNAADNRITGNSGINRLTGMDGKDVLSGNGGADVLNGGDGKDTMTGGTGADQFLFDFAANAATNADSITDFATGSDMLVFDDAVFTALTEMAGGPLHHLDPAQFHFGPSAASASDRILYHKATGSLYYDSDGLGGAAQILVATLTTKPMLTAADILLV